jgi:hypothetical protein
MKINGIEHLDIKIRDTLKVKPVVTKPVTPPPVSTPIVTTIKNKLFAPTVVQQ